MKKPEGIQFVRLADAPQSAWRNGGGFKQDLLQTPDMLVGVAQITRGGDFSHYADQQRFFAIIEGAGVELGDPPVRLTSSSQVHEFAGEDAPICSLIAGAATAFNLMVKRSTAKGFMRRVPIAVDSARSNIFWSTPLSAKPNQQASLNTYASRSLGVFVNHSAVLTERIGDASVDHVLNASGIAWISNCASVPNWSLRPINEADKLDAIVFEVIVA